MHFMCASERAVTVDSILHPLQYHSTVYLNQFSVDSVYLLQYHMHCAYLGSAALERAVLLAGRGQGSGTCLGGGTNWGPAEIQF